MQVFKNRSLFTLKSKLLKYSFSSSAGPLDNILSENPHKNAIRFENQNRIWTQQELASHSNAFAYGLVEQGYKAGDKLLLWVEKNSNAEVVAAQLGAAKAGVVLVPVYAQSQSELESLLSESQATGILYSPNSQLGEEKYSQIISQAVPELESLGNYGKELKSDRFPNLKYVVHTGFYTQPGQYKYRDTLVYASKNFNTLSLPSFDSSAPFYNNGNNSYSIQDLQSQAEQLRAEHNITENTAIFVAGDAKSTVSFALGALTSVLYGNYVVYTGKMNLEQVGKITQLYKDYALVLDGSVVGENNGAVQLNWNKSSLDALRSVAIFGDRAQDIQQLFSGVNTQVY
ncbi:hypothetical protein PPERSA_01195 [Pseudocohnilembus persalinus]|uniref:AMP-dependent synthetase/ligase domain-containing protein n=1 Tax=Pseudocohnilembus persalinus TaxID=266149 RepID=A0A0V0R154_PSEPJ|nr:hypothetical protein PPERSA_01195 [Pseudocohnilembus persalinus]|eukprot:KRX08265.1 hypothetical protein PPERSA_01195 [Pseudocohnilembus persalinus]